MKNTLKLNVQGKNKTIDVDVHHVFNAGYAGSDQEKVQEHIDELAKLGVPTPTTTPILFPVSDYVVSTTKHIQVQHEETSGEIEYVLIWHNNELYVTVGSDHTDRKLETFSVPMSKQAYPNVIAEDVWKYEDVKNHWDQLEFICWVTSGNEKKIYQQGTCADLLNPEQWEENFSKLNVEEDGNLFFSATINTEDNTLAFADKYEFELRDPVLHRSIKHQYEVNVLPESIE
ncbi:DUF2848 family protein [Virgibacillus alimentarius]|uniref:DUF2848 domain-containing protein n=1 Tax=Virgibacillus alimentarius TaxID=698769 RepID=A0ABS4SA13_9BACI|nr:MULTISPECIES: DUF2848 family protein [Virgibacillus]MBP2258167.1 hypothetical protein [Virgibacillus alimentarius]HLR69324.1 DUF2848 family protein [Virgibacillus sp.]